MIQRGISKAFHSLLTSPGDTCTVVLTLAMGIGANTAIVSVIHDVNPIVGLREK